MTPLLQGVSGLLTIVKQRLNNPLSQDRDWSGFEEPAIQRLKGVNLEQWRSANLAERTSCKRPRGSLDPLI